MHAVVYLIVALVAVGGALVWLRKAAAQSRALGPTAAKDRLMLNEPAEPTRQRRRRRPGPEPVSAEAEAPAPESPASAPVDEATAAAFKQGLAKTRGGFVARIGKLLSKKSFDQETLDELEETLFTADIGPRAADRLFHAVKQDLSRKELESPDIIWKHMKSAALQILHIDGVSDRPFELPASPSPFVLLILGVNGVGKTTTIGKLAARFAQAGKKVVLGAGDTFRAAATEQLEEWGRRSNVPVVKGKSGGDPSAVIFEAIRRGCDDGADIVICDTAGRLHSNSGLMDELKKIRRVCEKALPGSPHETWMVLDATTGQNAISQAKTFKQDMEISGIVLTKLDGSAKGGVVLGICDELKVPVRYVGVGEGIADLREFDHGAFVDALFAAEA